MKLPAAKLLGKVGPGVRAGIAAGLTAGLVVSLMMVGHSGGGSVNVHNSDANSALPADQTTGTTQPVDTAATTATTDLQSQVDKLDNRVTTVENKVNTIEQTTSTTGPTGCPAGHTYGGSLCQPDEYASTTTTTCPAGTEADPAGCVPMPTTTTTTPSLPAPTNIQVVWTDERMMDSRMVKVTWDAVPGAVSYHLSVDTYAGDDADASCCSAALAGHNQGRLIVTARDANGVNGAEAIVMMISPEATTTTTATTAP